LGELLFGEAISQAILFPAFLHVKGKVSAPHILQAGGPHNAVFVVWVSGGILHW
jgi:hypothetical protein